MNDPHVVALFYRIEHSTAFSYDNPQPFVDNLPEFHITIEGGQATVEPKAHFATAKEAREVVEPILKGWELDAALTHGGNVLEFAYQHAKVIDENVPPGSTVGFAAGRSTARGIGTAVLRQYPAPPAGLVVRPKSDVEAMLDKWKRHRAGQAELADTANFCLTALEGKQRTTRRREKAAEKFRISKRMLGRLGQLAERGRKYEGYDEPYTEIERAWLEAVLKKLIRRAAEIAYDPDAGRACITMDDPDLPRL